MQGQSLKWPHLEHKTPLQKNLVFGGLSDQLLKYENLIHWKGIFFFFFSVYAQSLKSGQISPKETSILKELNKFIHIISMTDLWVYIGIKVMRDSMAKTRCLYMCVYVHIEILCTLKLLIASIPHRIFS